MTDTTNIKALLNELRVTSTEKSGESEVARRVLILFDQLEAERQRAADLVLHVNTQANMREKAEKERDGVVKNYNRVTDERNSALYEVAALKAKLANPVVLPELCSVFEGEYADSPQIVPDQDGYVFYSHRVIESIIIAGFTVKE